MEVVFVGCGTTAEQEEVVVAVDVAESETFTETLMVPPDG